MTTNGPVAFTLVFLAALLAGLDARAEDARVKSQVDAIEVPAHKQHRLGLVLTAREAARYLAIYRDILMIDVRATIHVRRLGIATPVARNIPYVFDRNDGRPGTQPNWAYNKRFASEVKSLLVRRGAKPDATLFLICNSGTLSAIAAQALADLGYTRIYTVIDGFSGEPDEAAPANSTAWKHVGLPWTAEPRPSQMTNRPQT